MNLISEYDYKMKGIELASSYAGTIPFLIAQKEK